MKGKYFGGSKTGNRRRGAKEQDNSPVGLELLEQRLLLAAWYVDAAAAPGGDGTTLGTAFQTIQAGIDAAANTDTVNVADGTYTEDLVIAKTGLQLLSADGAGTTTIDLVDGVGISIQANAVNLGSTGHGFTIVADAVATTYDISLADALSGVTIAGNDITTVGDATRGLSVHTSTLLSVDDNTFLADEGDSMVMWDPATGSLATNTLISGNDFQVDSGIFTDAIVLADLAGGMNITGNSFAAPVVVCIGTGDVDSSGLTIQGNTFSNSTQTHNGLGVLFTRLDDNATGTLSNVQITQNLFDGTYGGIILDGSSETAGVVFGNNFQGGIGPGSIDWATLAIHQNDFDGSPQALWMYGAKLDQTVNINATDNFWGTNSGPIAANSTYQAAGGSLGSSTIVWDGAEAIATAVVDYLPWWNDLTGTTGSYGGTEFVPVTNLTQGTDYSSLQAAIDDAQNDDTIQAADGTFTEDLAVADATGLTLQSANGAAGTTIQLVTGAGIDVQDTADGFVLGGSGHGFTVLGGSGTTNLVQLTNGPAGVSIVDNTFDLAGNAMRGILVSNAGANVLAVDGNTFLSSQANEVCFYAPATVDLTVTNNTFTASNATGTVAIQLAGATASLGETASVTGSTISGFAQGILIQNGQGVSHLLIDDNAITQSTTGIEVSASGTGGNITTLTITNNQLTDNDTGLLIGNGTHVVAGEFVITGNTFDGNAVGLDNEHLTESVDATGNWWGSAGGPDIASNSSFNLAGGRGDGINQAMPGHVVYTPWLDAPAGDAIAPVTNTTQGTFYATIQAALDDALPGETLQTRDGTFTEDLTFAAANMTLVSADGGTTLQLVDGAGIAIGAAADGTTLGANGQGFTILSGAGTTNLIALVGGPTGVSIVGNTLDLTGNAGGGIAVDNSGSTGLVIEFNSLISADDNEVGIYAPLSVNLTISDNTFTAASISGTVAMQLPGVTTTAISSYIGGNEIVNFDQGILIQSGQGVSDLLVDGNTITSCVTGIEVAQFNPAGTAGDVTTLTVSNNVLHDNDTAILIGNGAHVLASQFDVSGNSISSNGVGLDNQSLTQTLDASGNWWGSAFGPAIASNGAAAQDQGDSIVEAVTDSVTYAPWLNAADGELVPYVTNTTQDKIFTSIQTAIDAAASGDVLQVSTGTFTENITITTALTLEGTDADTILVGANHGAVVSIDFVGSAAAGDFVLFTGFTVDPVQDATTATDYPIQIVTGSAYVTVSNNVIDASADVAAGIFLSGAYPVGHIAIADNTIPYNVAGIDFDLDNTVHGQGAVNVVISGNTLIAVADDSTGLVIGKAATVTITDNTFDVSDDTLIDATALRADDISGLTLSNNTVTGSGLAGDANTSIGFILLDINGASTVVANRLDGLSDAIQVSQGSGNLGTSGLVIGGIPAAENFFLDSAHVGVWIFSSGTSPVDLVTVQGNRFMNDFVGLQVGEPAPATTSDQIIASRITVRDNNFGLGNTTALANYETTTSPAGVSDTITPNGDWWGSSTGPRNASNPTGKGALVTGLVDFSHKNFRTTVTLAQADLTIAITDAKITLAGTIVPGDKGTVSVVVSNVGDGAVSKAKPVINLYLSTDNTYDASDMLLGSLTPTMNLAGGKSVTYSVPVVVPQASPGQSYHVVAYVDQTNVVAGELREDNNTDSSGTTYGLTYQFGQIANRKGNVAMTLADPVTGDKVVFSSTGVGHGTVTVVADVGFDIVLTGLVAASKVTVATPVKGNTATIRNVTSATGFAAFTAATSDLVGELSVTGALTTLSMGNVTTGDVSVTGAVGTLQALSWAGNINADTLGTLKVTGNFNADLVLANAASAAVALKTATISGGVTGATWVLTHGGLGTVKIAGSVNTLSLIASQGGVASLTMGNVADTHLSFGGVAKLVSAQQWVVGSITADVITTLNITGKGGTGNLDGVAVTANNSALAIPAKVAIGTVTVAGNMQNGSSIDSLAAIGDVGTISILKDMTGSTISVNGSKITAVKVGRMTDSTIFAGVATPADANTDGVFDLPTALGNGAGQISAGHTIAAVNILGYKGAPVGDLFTNSNIAANTVSLVNLKNTTLNNDALAFGVAGHTITKVTSRQGTVTYTWTAGQWKPTTFVPQNLTVRVI